MISHIENLSREVFPIIFKIAIVIFFFPCKYYNGPVMEISDFYVKHYPQINATTKHATKTIKELIKNIRLGIVSNGYADVN